MGGLRLGDRLRTRAEEVCADDAYDTREVRRHLRRQTAQVWPAPLNLSGHLLGGQGGGALLRLAQGRVPQASPGLGEARQHLRRSGLPGLLTHRLGGSEGNTCEPFNDKLASGDFLHREPRGAEHSGHHDHTQLSCK